MDDFERNHPGFDWRSTPLEEHPGKFDCPCPFHETVREKLALQRQTGNGPITIQLCPHHYKRYNEQMSRATKYKKVIHWLDDFMGYLRIRETSGPAEETCFFCRFLGQGNK